MAELPAVRELAKQLEQENIDVFLINIHDDAGTVLMEHFAFELSPTYILFDSSGKEILREHLSPSLDAIRSHLN